MPVSQLWKMDAITLGGAITFDQFESQSIDPGITQMLLRPAGHPHGLAVATQMIQPVIRFTTPLIGTAAGIALTGNAYTADSYVYFAVGASTGATGKTARATTSHRRLVISQCLVYIESISLPNRGQGLATIVVCAVYDGTNAPIVDAGSVALPGNLTGAKQFGCGPFKLTIAGPSTIDVEAESVNINLGVQLHKLAASSDVYDTFVGINTLDPTIEIRSLSELSVENFGLGAALDGTTGLLGFARQIGPRVSDATANHVKIVAADGTVFPGQATTEDGRWTDSVLVRPIAADDSSQPITLTASSAISFS